MPIPLGNEKTQAGNRQISRSDTDVRRVFDMRLDLEGGANCKAMQLKDFSNFGGGEGLARMLLELIILAHAPLRKGKDGANLSCGQA